MLNFILGYGVMVTQQILVLFFLVRIRVAQQNRRRFRFILKRFFIFIYVCIHNFIGMKFLFFKVKICCFCFFLL